MESKNEIKKRFYKENTEAFLQNVRKDGIIYTTGFGEDTVTFLVPLDEIGEAVWKRNMPAKFLIRYMIELP